MQKKTSNKEIRVFKNTEIRANAESRTITGYAAVFNSPSEDLGGFIEVIEPGAFDGVLDNDVRALVNHEDSKVLARTASGTLRISTDATGLRYEFDVPDTTYGNDLLVSVQRGDISQSSFSFSVDRDNQEWDRSKTPNVRTIKKVSQLFDVSAVTYPAYPDTSVAKRNLEQLQEQDAKAEQEAAADYINEQAHLSRALILKQKLLKR